MSLLISVALLGVPSDWFSSSESGASSSALAPSRLEGSFRLEAYSKQHAAKIEQLTGEQLTHHVSATELPTRVSHPTLH